MDNPLEEVGLNQLNEIEAADFYKKVTVYDENDQIRLFCLKGRVNDILTVLTEHGGEDVSKWRIVENENDS